MMPAVQERPQAALVPVPRDMLMQYVGQVLPHIESALAQGSDLTARDIFAQLAQGNWQLWAMERDGRVIGAVVTHLAVRPLRTVLQLLYVGGNNMDSWLSHLGVIEAWGKAEGAARVEVVGRKGWRRVLRDYRMTQVVLVKDLTNAE